MEIEQYNTICFKTANVPNFSEMEIEQNNYHLTVCQCPAFSVMKLVAK